MELRFTGHIPEKQREQQDNNGCVLDCEAFSEKKHMTVQKYIHKNTLDQTYWHTQ